LFSWLLLFTNTYGHWTQKKDHDMTSEIQVLDWQRLLWLPKSRSQLNKFYKELKLWMIACNNCKRNSALFFGHLPCVVLNCLAYNDKGVNFMFMIKYMYILWIVKQATFCWEHVFKQSIMYVIHSNNSIILGSSKSFAQKFELKWSLGGPLSKLCVKPPFSINFRCQIENQVSDYRLMGASSFTNLHTDLNQTWQKCIYCLNECSLYYLIFCITFSIFQ
jgi:hypothetical protein